MHAPPPPPPPPPPPLPAHAAGAVGCWLLAQSQHQASPELLPRVPHLPGARMACCHLLPPHCCPPPSLPRPPSRLPLQLPAPDAGPGPAAASRQEGRQAGHQVGAGGHQRGGRPQGEGRRAGGRGVGAGAGQEGGQGCGGWQRLPGGYSLAGAIRSPAGHLAAPASSHIGSRQRPPPASPPTNAAPLPALPACPPAGTTHPLVQGCSSVLYFEARKHKDLYLWVAKAPGGPSAKFHVTNG